MAKQYLIDQEQLEEIIHYKDMFQLNSQYIKELCSSEKHDIVYGYELGKMYSHLSDCFLEMMDLVTSIKEKQVIPELNKEV